MPGLTRRLLLAVLATLVSAVAASPAGAAGHTTRSVRTTTSANVGIVDIYTTLGYQDGAAAAGTGMLISRTGEVLTNNHVIRGATKFKVVDVTTHRSYNATVVGYSVSHDIAVLQLANASHMQTIRLGGYVKLHVGQQVIARGNAQGRGGVPKAARGQVIALHRKIVARDITGESETLRNVIATNTAVEPGDSGGPLEDAHNRAIGMVTAGSTVGAARGFAIPIRQALLYARTIMKGKSSTTIHVGPTAFLGVVLKDVSGGTQIQQVLPNLPADDAGLVAGDVITSLNDSPISSMADMRQALLSLAVGTAVSIGWTDANGVAQTGTITPASGPPQ
ncbi:MAG TPA: trypsin-like peptidase domain-containing protein [Gaiellaceae bacterium]|nr:trypsin-like peptidase domain-containing protein [Gaiellaceae bacterium]